MGCCFLFWTQIGVIEIGELILNAVALEFVLRIDDILFVCFVPTRIRALIKHGKPLNAPSILKTKDGLDIRSVLSFLRRLSCRRIQISGLCAAIYFVATRAACRRTNGTSHTRR